MPTISVRHQYLELNWPSLNQIINPRTLVLGSFNPYNGRTNVVDYYYGRSSNYFWKTIASIRELDENYFYQRIERKLEIMKCRFICMDIINEINFSSDKQEFLNEYINNKIFSNFLDQNIWVSKTNFRNNDIQLSRSYNQDVINLLRNTTTITKVIHTMGNIRINTLSTNPKEKRLGNMGFQSYVSQIKNICQERGIEFINQSLSPSSYAVNNGNTSLNELSDYLRNNLNLN
jgi:hypothetical protein